MEFFWPVDWGTWLQPASGAPGPCLTVCRRRFIFWMEKQVSAKIKAELRLQLREIGKNSSIKWLNSPALRRMSVSALFGDGN